MSKQNNKTIQKPKVSAKTLYKNNLYLIKVLFKASPLGMVLCMLEKFRVAVFVFIEWTWLINYVLESVEYHRGFEKTITAIAIVFGLLVVTSTLSGVAWQRFSPKVLLKAKEKLKDTIYDKAKSCDLEKFDNPEYYNDFVLTVEKCDFMIEGTFNMLMNLCDCFGGIITTGAFFATKNLPATILVLITTVIKIGVQLSRSKLWYGKNKEAQPKYRKADYTKRLFYLLDYAKELRLNPDSKSNAFERYDQSYGELLGTLRKYDKKLVLNNILSTLLQEPIINLLLILLLIYQATVLHTISYSMIIVITSSCWRLSWDLTIFTTTITNTAESCLYVDKIKSFLAEKCKITSKKNLSVDNKPKEITLENVKFAYNDKDGEIIKGISLNIKPKEKIALVGYNGAGKTTLIKLIMRLYDPTDGIIKQDGTDIKDFDVEQYRKSIGVIFQDFNIYAATLKENVVMDISDNVSDKKVCTSLENSGFKDKLDDLKDGVDTLLTTEFDDNGVNLSGGESQKVAVSRAFFKKAGLIILDEPSSALDPIAEYNLNKYMLSAAKDSTVIFISHRLSTTRIADKIYMLENGKIVEQGSHEELLKQNGKYAQMWHTQAEKYLD